MEGHVADQLPFRWGWLATDLGSYRPYPREYMTYSLFSFEDLPPIPEATFTGTFHWLASQKDVEYRVGREYWDHEYWEWHERESLKRLSHLVSSAQQRGFSLPDAFVRFMASTELRHRIPSCTACFFNLPTEIFPCPGSEQGYLIRFLSDQQWVATWSLYFTPQGEQCVLIDITPSPEEEDESARAVENKTVESYIICSRSFEAFLYRFWIENTLWSILHRGFWIETASGSILYEDSIEPQQLIRGEGLSLSEEQRQYLLHYYYRNSQAKER